MTKASDNYEFAIKSTLVKASWGNANLQIEEDHSAGSNRHVPDVRLFSYGKPVSIEVKLNAGAQMGGSSVTYSTKTGTFESLETPIETLTPHLEPKKNAFDTLLNELGVLAVPLSCSKEKWEQARMAGYLKPCNMAIEANTEFIVSHYNAKDTYYIQIGKAGLFFMGKNPLDLPVPELNAKANIEVRFGRSGSRTNSEGVPMVSAGIRVQGRLKEPIQSPYSLERADDVNHLFG